MIQSRVRLIERFDVITDEIRRRSIAALNEAAEAGRAVAETKANTPKPIARFEPVPARGIDNGFASGLRAGPLTRIFDHGSLGRHEGRLKRGRRPEWEVSRGANPYIAHRATDLAGKGVAPRRILTAARTAGRKQLINRLLSR